MFVEKNLWKSWCWLFRREIPLTLTLFLSFPATFHVSPALKRVLPLRVSLVKRGMAPPKPPTKNTENRWVEVLNKNTPREVRWTKGDEIYNIYFKHNIWYCLLMYIYIYQRNTLWETMYICISYYKLHCIWYNKYTHEYKWCISIWYRVYD